MKKLYFVYVLVLTSLFGQSQIGYGVLDTNNVRAGVMVNGVLFANPAQYSGAFECPKNSGVHTIYASGLWIAGVSPDQQLKSATATYGQGEADYFPGPLTVDGSAETSAAVMQAFDRVWTANKADIDLHLQFLDAFYTNTLDQVFPNGYTIPQWFYEWPAMGDVSAGQALYLAPFMDVDLDGFYDPQAGDYPLFPGDECLYFIINDKGGIHPSGSLPIGIEAHGFVYAYHTPSDPVVNNTVYVHYTLINRGTQTLSNTYVGIWSDLDIGTSVDDRVGCHVKGSAYYGYNGDAYDEPSISSQGYGENAPVQVVTFLGGPFASANQLDDALPASVSEEQVYGSYGPGFDDGTIDNERLGLCGFMHHTNSGNPINGDPVVPSHFYNLMRGIWLNNSVLTYGGNGTGQGQNATETQAKYMFPGNSDPAWLSTDGVQQDFWSEETAEWASGDRRGLGSMGPFDLLPGDVHMIDLAFTALDTVGGSIGVEDAVGDATGALRSHFISNVVPAMVNFGPTVGMVESTTTNRLELTLYPNPARESFTVEHPENVHLLVYSSDGRLVHQNFSAQNRTIIRVDHWPNGLYNLRTVNNKGQSTTKLLIVNR